jgi:hypothetical protein
MHSCAPDYSYYYDISYYGALPVGNVPVHTPAVIIVAAEDGDMTNTNGSTTPGCEEANEQCRVMCARFNSGVKDNDCAVYDGLGEAMHGTSCTCGDEDETTGASSTIHESGSYSGTLGDVGNASITGGVTKDGLGGTISGAFGDDFGGSITGGLGEDGLGGSISGKLGDEDVSFDFGTFGSNEGGGGRGGILDSLLGLGTTDDEDETSDGPGGLATGLGSLIEGIKPLIADAFVTSTPTPAPVEEFAVEESTPVVSADAEHLQQEADEAKQAAAEAKDVAEEEILAAVDAQKRADEAIAADAVVSDEEPSAVNIILSAEGAEAKVGEWAGAGGTLAESAVREEHAALEAPVESYAASVESTSAPEDRHSTERVVLSATAMVSGAITSICFAVVLVQAIAQRRRRAARMEKLQEIYSARPGVRDFFKRMSGERMPTHSTPCANSALHFADTDTEAL